MTVAARVAMPPMTGVKRPMACFPIVADAQKRGSLLCKSLPQALGSVKRL